MELITDPAILEGYLRDASNLEGGHADGLFRPRTADEIAEILRRAQAEGIPVTVTAGRTSTTGAPVPFGGWLLSMEHLTAIETIDQDRAVAQAGVRLGELQDAIEARGRLFPPDPTSRYECTLGAAIACNASGARSFRYGPTRPWIEAIEAVLPTGAILQVTRETPIPGDWPMPAWTEPPVKTAAGYAPSDNLLDLLIGHEGTLAVITRATCKLTDLPEGILGLLAFFPTRQAAVGAATALRQTVRAEPSGALSPQCIEYLDAACLDLVRARVGGVPESARAALFCEQAIHRPLDASTHLDAWLGLLQTHAGELADETLVTETDAARRQLHAMRHAIPAGINERVVHNGMPKVGTDLAVPDAELDWVMGRYEACPLPSLTFGHIGDNHLHCNVLPTTAAELELARAWYADLSAEVVARGGTISAEHGIGKLKHALLARQVGPETLAAFAHLKRTIDPSWILGRGTLLGSPEPTSPQAQRARAL